MSFEELVRRPEEKKEGRKIPGGWSGVKNIERRRPKTQESRADKKKEKTEQKSRARQQPRGTGRVEQPATSSGMWPYLVADRLHGHLWELVGNVGGDWGSRLGQWES
ncbi:hypothetical protein NDU88_006843 [Pleurodeles waltl]|uniref:Uncharacterized protein n=1 Tax=Pleurodeles waltl TaxID=8319 RepID=A0AAV7P0K6_PLEWA|nr:hypothetical protein NDU88_006843 [Pleurodeles waltl]